MLSIFASLGSLLKLRTICTDGVVFRLHCRLTVLFLISASILLSCRQYFGDPIYCNQSDEKMNKIIENYCWIHSTFVLPHAWDLPVGGKVAHPGIDSSYGKPRKYHAYYQWVAFVLLLQGILFYMPHYLWKMYERGMMRDLTLNLQHPVLPRDEIVKSYELLSHALHIHWGHFSGYFGKYVLCEVLTFLNVIGQIYLLDTFLGDAFSDFGIKVLQFSEWRQYDRTDPLVQVFPRMTKCVFHTYGSSGSVQSVDALCLLPLNVLNEKIFIALWFWMVLLACLIGLVLAYRFMLYYSPILRYTVLKIKAPAISTVTLDRMVRSSKASDWFVLYLLSKNIASHHYVSVVNRLYAGMEQTGRETTLEHEETTFV